MRRREHTREYEGRHETQKNHKMAFDVLNAKKLMQKL
jgi:hypothetical protein